MKKKTVKPQKSKGTVLELRGITKTYNQGLDNEVKVLKGVDLKIREGDFAAIMGPSGSGKTTMLDIIGCLLRPTSGKVFVEGVDTSSLSERRLAEIRGKSLGFVFQQYNLIASLTATENVELPLRILGAPKGEARKRAVELLTLVGLSHRANNKPSQLSGGEQQRVAIARALANKPGILLGDEPTGNLDTNTGQAILDILKNLNKEEGYTVVIVTHDQRISKITDYVVRMTDGQIMG